MDLSTIYEGYSCNKTQINDSSRNFYFGPQRSSPQPPDQVAQVPPQARGAATRENPNMSADVPPTWWRGDWQPLPPGIKGWKIETRTQIRKATTVWARDLGNRWHMANVRKNHGDKLEVLLLGTFSGKGLDHPLLKDMGPMMSCLWHPEHGGRGAAWVWDSRTPYPPIRIYGESASRLHPKTIMHVREIQLLPIENAVCLVDLAIGPDSDKWLDQLQIVFNDHRLAATLQSGPIDRANSRKLMEPYSSKRSALEQRPTVPGENYYVHNMQLVNAEKYFSPSVRRHKMSGWSPGARLDERPKDPIDGRFQEPIQNPSGLTTKMKDSNIASNERTGGEALHLNELRPVNERVHRQPTKEPAITSYGPQPEQHTQSQVKSSRVDEEGLVRYDVPVPHKAQDVMRAPSSATLAKRPVASVSSRDQKSFNNDRVFRDQQLSRRKDHYSPESRKTRSSGRSRSSSPRRHSTTFDDWFNGQGDAHQSQKDYRDREYRVPASPSEMFDVRQAQDNSCGGYSDPRGERLSKRQNPYQKHSRSARLSRQEKSKAPIPHASGSEAVEPRGPRAKGHPQPTHSKSFAGGRGRAMI